MAEGADEVSAAEGGEAATVVALLGVEGAGGGGSRRHASASAQTSSERFRARDIEGRGDAATPVYAPFGFASSHAIPSASHASMSDENQCPTSPIPMNRTRTPCFSRRLATPTM